MKDIYQKLAYKYQALKVPLGWVVLGLVCLTFILIYFGAKPPLVFANVILFLWLLWLWITLMTFGPKIDKEENIPSIEKFLGWDIKEPKIFNRSKMLAVHSIGATVFLIYLAIFTTVFIIQIIR